MGRGNFPFLSFNRGLISPKALARVDLDRTRLSAEIMTNWLAKTQGAMTLRPGTKWLGSTLNDTGAEFVEFVASTDDVALIELTNEKMRVWTGDDAHSLALLSRIPNSTTSTLSLTDTQGWINASAGGAAPLAQGIDLIPRFTSTAPVNAVSVEAQSEYSTTYAAWKAADDSLTTWWRPASAIAQWWKVDFGSPTRVYQHAIRAHSAGTAPRNWTLQGNNVDTGTGWTTEVTVTNQTSWDALERRIFTDTGYTDTGANAWRYWRVSVTSNNGATWLALKEVEMFERVDTGAAPQVSFTSQGLVLNPTAVGSIARAVKEVSVDTGLAAAETLGEHALAITVSRGPVTFRCGSSSQADDYIRETQLGTGYHNLAFRPDGNFFLTFQNDVIADRIVSSVEMSDTGTVEIQTRWTAADLEGVRYDQSADIVYVDCEGIESQKIERRGSGRSWSVVDYAPNDGPFLTTATSSAKMQPSNFFGNITIESSIPFFTSGHVGSLIRIFHSGQSGRWNLGALDAATDAIEMTGIGDTGTANPTNERQIVVSVVGNYTGQIAVERSFDGPDRGFKLASVNFGGDSGANDTGTFVRTINDEDHNVKVWYRAIMAAYTSGAANVSVTYRNGGQTGIARITGFVSNTEVTAEVLRRFSDTGPSDNWQESYWSGARSYPTAVALHGGRLAHAQGGSIFLSVADDYESFDDETDGDAAPIIRTLGSGPVDRIHYLTSLLRLIVGTAGAELALRSSSLDEPLTPDNSSAGTFSTQGSANLRAVKMDNRAIFLQRSKKKLFMVGAGTQSSSTFGDYEGFELTLLVPDLLAAGVVSIAVQRQPDTRIHCVLADGRVAILTYEPSEEVICWTLWEGDTGTAAAVEKVAVLPGLDEDAVYYHIRRTINGSTKRYIEKWAKESECYGDSGLNWLMDCARSYTDTGRTKTLTDVATHLAGESVVAWGSLDSGSYPHVDLSPDVNGVQTRYTVDTGGDVTFPILTDGVHHAVVGLPYSAHWKSAKLAYAADGGTALSQMKTTDKIAFVLYQTHNNGLFFGNDTGNLDPLPRVNNAGAVVDPDLIFSEYDETAMPFPGLWSADSRIVLRGKSPRPATVLAAVPTVATKDKV